MLASVLMMSACSTGQPLTSQQALEQNFQVLRDAATKTVTDKERLTVLLKVSRTLEKTVSEYNHSYVEFAKALQTLNRNYDTPRAQQESLLSEFRSTRELTMKKVINSHFEMIALTTKAEWKKIVKYETRAFETMREIPLDQLGIGS